MPLSQAHFIKNLPTFWFPERVEFRDQYNQIFRDALLHFKTHGDITLINKLIAPIPNKTAKQAIVQHCLSSLNLSWDEKKQSFKGKLGDKANEIIPSFRAIEKALPVLIDDEYIALEKSVYNKEEFVDFVLDTIILNRNAFTQSDLEKIEETLEIIKKRLSKLMNIKEDK